MDAFAKRSQDLAVQSQENGFFEREITPITLPDGTVISKDDGPRAGTTLEKLGSLSPVFRPDGQVTAGNACPLNDGAAAVIVMSDTRAKELGIKPLARIISSGVTGLNPEIMGLGPIEACRQAMKRAGMTIDDIDIVEINEAFAAQVLPSAEHLGIDMDKLNPNGGSIALGHPFGMTGARIMTTLLNGLEDSGKTHRHGEHVRRRRPRHGHDRRAAVRSASPGQARPVWPGNAGYGGAGSGAGVRGRRGTRRPAKRGLRGRGTRGTAVLGAEQACEVDEARGGRPSAACVAGERGVTSAVRRWRCSRGRGGWCR